ncbi:MAG TPA: signal peptidase I [Candidatus Babeliales bacterium]|nr:signal peptidase I [Candidatus Babeliales bacterium]
MLQGSKISQSGFLASVREFITLLLIVLIVRIFLFGLYQVPTGSMETTMLVGERFFADKLSYFLRTPHRGEIISLNAPDFVYSPNPVVKLLQLYVLGPIPFNWGPDNWTKRVIGIPGDHVEGKIENGKPVVYLNGKVLDEPYVNTYPLIKVRAEDIQAQCDRIEKEMVAAHGRIAIDRTALERFIEQRGGYCPRSYDPSKPYDAQPFYRIDQNRVVSFDLIMPYTPIRPDMPAIEIPEGTNFWNGSDSFSVYLKDDEYWCMGDNRLGSRDCRAFGPFKGEWIRGRIVFRIWSMDSNESWWIVDLIKHPIDFWKRVRWQRFFQWVH